MKNGRSDMDESEIIFHAPEVNKIIGLNKWISQISEHIITVNAIGLDYFHPTLHSS